jgi:UDP-glucose 4-epimerase
MSKIFISGVAGFLGSHLADAMLTQGHAVVGIDNLIGGYRDNVPDGVQFVEVDCNSFESVRALMAGADVVYHTAATPHEGLSVFSPHENAKHGYLACASIFSAACAVKARRIVYMTSMARYGTNTVPFTEDMEPRPQDPYGIGKVAAEQLLRNLCSVHGVDFVIACPHNIYGPRQKYDDPFRNVASIFANMMLQGRQPFIYGDGQQKRCFSFVSDDIGPLRQMAFDPACSGQVINIGPDDEFVTISELAAIVADIVGMELHPVAMPDRPQEVRLANCSADKARRLLGYEARVPIRVGMHHLVDWIRRRGVRPFEYHLGIEIPSDRMPPTWRKRLF